MSIKKNRENDFILVLTLIVYFIFLDVLFIASTIANIINFDINSFVAWANLSVSLGMLIICIYASFKVIALLIEDIKNRNKKKGDK